MPSQAEWGVVRIACLFHRKLWPALIALCLSMPGVAWAGSYELGQGYALPWLGLTAGGYISVQANNLKNEKSKAALQDLSLFLHSDPTPTWHFFSEMELSNALVLTRDGFTTTDADLDFERLYVDYNVSPRQTLRLGKFLTPVGRWNQIHADPLVWTVSRPLTTAAPFARNASGIQLYGSRPLGLSAIDYHIYLDDSALFDPTEGHELTYMDVDVTPNPTSSFEHGGGMRLQYRTMDDAFQAGLSAARYRLKDLPRFKDLVGLDLFYTKNDIEVSGETVYRQDEGASANTEWGGFLQLVLPMGRDLYAIAYHERYKAQLFSGVLNTTSVGITYRPKPPLSIKLERRDSWGQERLAPDGWLFSIAILL
ncbi:MAG TPA: hypothetical protein VEP67_11170 [Thiobacillaceae bacterium]|nr:hypothetical protein [Thiobacillaceae bacterium]